jgi:hypothetical protein
MIICTLSDGWLMSMPTIRESPSSNLGESEYVFRNNARWSLYTKRWVSMKSRDHPTPSCI